MVYVKSLHNIFLLQLLGVDSSVLKEALTHKKIIAKGEEVCYILVTTLLCSLNVTLEQASLMFSLKPDFLLYICPSYS